MRTLVTGATGLIGHAVARQLLSEGHKVRALVRDLAKAQAVVPSGTELVRGDVEDPASLAGACAGIDWVFHVAGMPEQWQPDERVFDRVNRQGTANVMAAALSAGVRRVVHTSTMDVFAAATGGILVEANLDPEPKHTAYERSKQAAEREVEAARAKGLHVVYVNPGAVYGPGPVHIAANGLFIQFLNGQLPLIPPGGMALAYVEGVARAHVLAAERGREGERYLVGDEHADNHELIALIAREAGVTKLPKLAPAWLLKTLASTSAPFARWFGFTPLIAPGQLSFLLWNPRIDSSKAQRELGFVPTPLAEGVRATVAFLRAQHLVP